MNTDVWSSVVHTQDKYLEVQACAHIQWADVESPGATTSTTTPQEERTEMERRPVLLYVLPLTVNPTYQRA